MEVNNLFLLEILLEVKIKELIFQLIVFGKLNLIYL